MALRLIAMLLLASSATEAFEAVRVGASCAAVYWQPSEIGSASTVALAASTALPPVSSGTWEVFTANASKAMLDLAGGTTLFIRVNFTLP